MIFINGIIASREDIELLSYRILKQDLQFSASKDKFGNQYVKTED